VDLTGMAPTLTLLRGAWPNPFSGETAIRLDLPGSREVRLTVHSADGRQVATLLEGMLPAGRREVRWDGRDQFGRRVPGGAYHCRIETGGLSQAQMLLLLTR
jgi:flagellar hook assembly protein FlgD